MSANSIRELKRRMTSVLSTQKVTKVVKLISSSYIRKALGVMNDSNAASKAMSEILADILSTISHHSENMMHPLMSSKLSGSGDTSLAILVTSNRGLCGYYNNAVIKLCKNTLNSMQPHKMICIGARGAKAFPGSERLDLVSRGKVAPLDEVRLLRERIVSMYLTREINLVEIFYTHYNNAISSVPVHMRLLPIKIKDITDMHMGNTAIYDSPKEDILNRALEHYLDACLYNALAHSCLSEESARVTAMDGAERNTRTVIDDLRKKINRGRQAAITTTLIDIINSSESL